MDSALLLPPPDLDSFLESWKRELNFSHQQLSDDSIVVDNPSNPPSISTTTPPSSSTTTLTLSSTPQEKPILPFPATSLGLYRVLPKEVVERVAIGLSLGLHAIDTAQLYGNERACVEALRRFSGHKRCFTTSKIYDAAFPEQLAKQAQKTIACFTNPDNGAMELDCLLLHRPMPQANWAALVEICGDRIPYLGVSNYDLQSLQNLLKHCEDNQLRKPNVVQIEVHPFLDCAPLIDFCHKEGIVVQGHTVLAQGKHFSHPVVAGLALKYSVSPAVVLLSWALSKQISVCISSHSRNHLEELLHQARADLLLAEDIQELNGLHHTSYQRFYNKYSMMPYATLTSVPDEDEYIHNVVEQLKKDQFSENPSSICEHVPLQGDGYRTVGRKIAMLLFPEDPGDGSSMARYRTLVKKLRQTRLEFQRANKLLRKGGAPSCALRRKTGPYSEAIVDPQPMPVTVTDPVEFAPIFDFLGSSVSLPQGDTVFVRGAVFPDGRLDLCKQVVGPTSLPKLCQVVKETKIIKHFLLGNNVALFDHELAGAEAFADVMRDNTCAIETWYLAGNCIGPNALEIMCDALRENTQAKALWLKRNPVGPLGALHLNRLLCVNETLVLLDLHNCAIGDEGLKNLLHSPKDIKALKHLYLDANALESTTPLAQWCAVGKPTTLYLSINRLRDLAIIELAAALKGNTYLKRLCLSSTHMNNDGARAVIDMAMNCPSLICLDLGNYKSTADMGEHPGNFFDDAVLPDLIKLVNESAKLEYLSVASSRISEEGLALIPRNTRVSLDLGRKREHQHNAHTLYKDQIRFVKHPKRVVHIDSIYRGKM